MDNEMNSFRSEDDGAKVLKLWVRKMILLLKTHQQYPGIKLFAFLFLLILNHNLPDYGKDVFK